ncbi:unnamed protein product [Closterium sp. NIES-53]
MYAAIDSAEGDCYLCVPPELGIDAAVLGGSESAAQGTSESAALGTSESAALGAGESALSGTVPTKALHTFTLDSGATRSFFRDSTTLTPLSRPVAVSLADPSGGPALAHSSTVLPCPAAPSGLHLPSFSTNLVSGAELQDAWVDQFTPGGQRETHCTCSRTGRHLATFIRRPGSSLYTLTTASPQTLLWHHRLGHPSLPRLRGMASRTLVSGLPRSLPPLPPGPAPTCVPCVEGRQHVAPPPPAALPPQQLRASGAKAAGGAAGAAAAGGASGASGGAAGAGAAGPGGAGAGGGGTVGGPAGVGAAGGAGAAGPGGARTGGTGAAGAGGAAGVGAIGAGAVATGGAAGAGAVGGPGAGGAAGVVAGVRGAEGTGARSYAASESRPASPESRPASPESRPESHVPAGCRVPSQRPPPFHGTHSMNLHPSTAPQRVPLPSPSASSLPALTDPESHSLRTASPTLSRLLATVVTDPSFEFTAASALVAELVDFAAHCRLDYTASLVAESESASVYPRSVGGECALGTDVFEDRQEEFECFAAAVPHLVSMLLAPEGDPDAPDIPTPRSYAEVIEGPYSSQWQAAMDAEMASWKVKRPPGSPPVFKARITAFLEGSLHKEIWLRRPPGLTESFPAGTQWSLWRPVYGLRQAPREWHDTLRTTLVALGFAPSTADPSLFLRTDFSCT